MTDYWMSTKSPPRMFRPHKRTAEIETTLRANVGVDSALLARDLGIARNWVESYQRALGLRDFALNASKGNRYILNMRGRGKKLKNNC